MRTFVKPGSVITFTAPNATADADLSAGAGVLIGTVFGVCTGDVAKGAEGEMMTDGVHLLAKVSAQAWTVGAAIYWDDTNKVCTTSSGGNKLIGACVEEAAANPSSFGMVRLNGVAVA